MSDIQKLDQLQAWVQKTLPAVFDDSLSYYELLSKVLYGLNLDVAKINEVIDTLGEKVDIDNLTNVRKLDQNANFTGSWWGITKPVHIEGGIDAVVEQNQNNIAITQDQLNSLNVNVKRFGAKGDGMTDDTTAFLTAIQNCPKGGNLYIPYGNYVISQMLVFNKNMSVSGSNIQDDTQNNIPLTGSILSFTSNVPLECAIKINADGVHIDNVFINNNSTVKTNIPVGLKVLPFIGGVVWNIDLRNLYIKNFTQHGFYAEGLLVSSLQHCFASDCGNGFYLVGGTDNGTSVKFDSCWALKNSGYGFYLNTYYYTSFANCASDANNIGYWLANCKGITMTSCGIEGSQKEHIYLQSTNEFTAIGCMGVQANQSNTADSDVTYLLATSDCKNITLIACNDYSPAHGSYSVSIGSGTITFINCVMPKSVVMNSQVYTLNSDSTYSLNSPLQMPMFNGTDTSIGNFKPINVPVGTGFTMPNNGVWLYFLNKFNNGSYVTTMSNFVAGGTLLINAETGISYGGFCIRVR
jgi:hypothetical protein